MGAAASVPRPDVDKPAEPLKVAGKSTTILAVAGWAVFEADKVLRHGCPIGEAEQVIAIIDSCQAVHSPFIKTAKEASSSAVTFFFLIPSTTSAAEFLTCQEMGIPNLIASIFKVLSEGWDVRFIRRDDWFTNGGMAIIEPMMEQNKKVYPAEESQNMYDFICTQALQTKLLKRRPWMFHCIGEGVEESDVSEGLEVFEGKHEETKFVFKDLAALQAAGKVGEPMPAKLNPLVHSDSSRKRVYVGFGESAAKFASALGVNVERVDGWELKGKIGYEGCDLWEDKNEKFLGLLDEREKLYFKERAEEKEAEEKAEEAAEEAEDEEEVTWETKWTIPEEEREVIKAGLVKKAAAVYTFNGAPLTEALNGFFMGEASPVFLVAPSDVMSGPWEGSSSFANWLAPGFIAESRETMPDASCMLVLAMDSFESFGGPSYGVQFMHYAIENIELGLFLTWDEMPQLKSLLSIPGDITRTIQRNTVMFPRTCWLTFSSALGQTLEENEILTPELTFGPATPLQEQLFATKTAFFFARPDGTFITRHAVPLDCEQGLSLISPARLINKLLKKCLIEDLAKYYEENKDEQLKTFGDVGLLREADSNMTDLIDELDRTVSGKYEEEEEDEE
eukprot:TRINITY_DN75956_c0_g1_i1.p1 TRINITY_DN75956_c0_g1~~TRINITY_DN75956_c0_g1_i1.p1  ORF type:complete len:620 (+),score=141.77 TRINITY_DN75956_c0_g1_i1:88-1947(+)